MRFSPAGCSCCGGGVGCTACCMDPSFEGDITVDFTAGVTPGLENDAIQLNGFSSTLRFFSTSADGCVRVWTTYDSEYSSADYLYMSYSPPFRSYYAEIYRLMCTGNTLTAFLNVFRVQWGAGFACANTFFNGGSCHYQQALTVTSCDPVLAIATFALPDGSYSTADGCAYPSCTAGYEFVFQATFTG
jgi:hypothetical protein